MTKQPFDEKDIILRLPADQYAFERVFVRSKAPFAVSMYWNVEGRWCPCQPTMHDAAELLRQLAEQKQEMEQP